MFGNFIPTGERVRTNCFPTRFIHISEKKLLHPIKWQRSVFQHVERHTRDKWIVILPNKNETDQIYTPHGFYVGFFMWIAFHIYL